MIRLCQVSRIYPGARRPAVADLDLHVQRGDLLALVGRSGSGKTTTLKMVNRLQEPTSGRIAVAGEDVSGLDPVLLRRRIGYVFQEVGLFPHLSVAGNVAVVPRLLGWSEARIRERLAELLELVGMPAGEFADRRPRQLSAGQAQRIGLARALAAGPAVMLMDEPFGALDPLTRDELQHEYRRLHDRLGLTTVLVTHDMTEALLLADCIGVMEGGRLLQVGAPREVLSHPRHDSVARLLATPREQAARIDDLLAPGQEG